jgi:hypothetical protein
MIKYLRIPMKYLRVPIDDKMSRHSDWSLAKEKVENN